MRKSLHPKGEVVARPTERARTHEHAVRALTSAIKALRLYPETSPIPTQSAETAIAAIRDAVATEPGTAELTLVVGRDGFAVDDEELTSVAGSGDDLLSLLRAHGVSMLVISASCDATQLIDTLSILTAPADEVRASGGVGEALARHAVTAVRVTELHLSVVGALDEAARLAEDLDDFLRSIAGDSKRLAAWLSGAVTGDASALEEGLMELVRVSGPSRYADLLASLAQAFSLLEQDGKDALLDLSFYPGPTRDLAAGVFSLLGADEIAGAVLGGRFGRNMLSLSSALTKLPLERVTQEVRAEVQALLPASGHTPHEAEFLAHMIAVREQAEPEPPLVEADARYRDVAAEAARGDAELPDAQAQAAISGDRHHLDAAAVRTMLALMDQQQDFELFCHGMDSLAALVGPLVAQADITLASTVLSELTRREELDLGPWPELSARVQAAVDTATGLQTMSALIGLLAETPEALGEARSFVRLTGSVGIENLVAAAIELKEPGLAIAEALLGGRLTAPLASQAISAQWHQLRPVVARLMRSDSAGTITSVRALMHRPDEQSRRETVLGAADADGPLAVSLLASALNDPATEVVIAAARGLGTSRAPGAAEALAERLEHTALDDEDFDVVVELIGSFAQLSGPVADSVLAQLSTRRSFIKSARHGEIQDLVRRAIAYRAAAGSA